MYTFGNLIQRLLVRHRLGPFFLAIILVVCGIIVGATSHQVIYERANHVVMRHYLSASSDSRTYIELQDGSLYFLKQSDFTPALNTTSLLSRTATFVYDPQETEDVNIAATNNSAKLSGTGAIIVQLISYGADSSTKTFSTREYTTYPHGFYRNNWGLAANFMVVGIILGTLLFFFARYRKPKDLISPTLQAGFVAQPSTPIITKKEPIEVSSQPPADISYSQQISFPSESISYTKQSPDAFSSDQVSFPSERISYPQQMPFPSVSYPYPQQSPPYAPYPQANPASHAGRYGISPFDPSWNPGPAQMPGGSLSSDFSSATPDP